MLAIVLGTGRVYPSIRIGFACEVRHHIPEDGHASWNQIFEEPTAVSTKRITQIVGLTLKGWLRKR